MRDEVILRTMRYRRGADRVNPLQQPAARTIEIRLVYPPHLTDKISERPVSNMRYKIFVGSWRIQGTTDELGMLRTKVPATAKTGKLMLWPKEQVYDNAQPLWTLDIEFKVLPSPFDGFGAMFRLSNLGLVSAVALPDDEELRSALHRFQTRFAPNASGPDTRGILEQVHGS